MTAPTVVFSYVFEVLTTGDNGIKRDIMYKTNFEIELYFFVVMVHYRDKTLILKRKDYPH